MILQLAHQSLRYLEDSSVTDINPDDVTPGVLGFAFTAVFAIVVILIGLDMYRRIRRMNYREEVRADIAAEMSDGDTDGVDEGPQRPE